QEPVTGDRCQNPTTENPKYFTLKAYTFTPNKITNPKTFHNNIFKITILLIQETENGPTKIHNIIKEESEKIDRKKRRGVDKTEHSFRKLFQRYQKLKSEKRKLSDTLRNSSAKQQKLKVEIAQLKLNRSDLKEELEDLKEKLDLKGSKIPFSKSPEIVTLNQELSAFKALSIVFKEELVRLDEQNKLLKSDLKTINKKYGWAHHLLERRNFELQYEYERRKLGEMCADYGIKALRDLSEEMEKMKEDLTKTRHNLKLMTLKWDMDIAEIWDNKNHQNIHSEESLARQESIVSTEIGFFGTSSSSSEGDKIASSKSLEIVSLNQELLAFKALITAFKEELASLDEENENLKTDFTTINSEYVMAYHLLESRNAERQYECQRQKLGEMCAVYGIKALFYLSKEMEKETENGPAKVHNIIKEENEKITEGKEEKLTKLNTVFKNYSKAKQRKLKTEIAQLKLNRSDLREELEDLKEKLDLKGSKIPFSKSLENFTLNQELSALKALSIVFKEELVRLDEQNKKLKADLTTINNKYGWAHHLLERRNVELQYEYERRKLGEMCADYGIKALRDLSEEMEKMKKDLKKTRHNLKLMTLKRDMDIAEIWDNKNNQNIHSEE
ncbi:hypothetical protein QYM36_008991, partial [Artemia franciscana]